MKAQLIIETGTEPVVIDFNIQDESETTTLTMTSAGVQIHTKDEPKITVQ